MKIHSQTLTQILDTFRFDCKMLYCRAETWIYRLSRNSFEKKIVMKQDMKYTESHVDDRHKKLAFIIKSVSEVIPDIRINTDIGFFSQVFVKKA